jgi:hypothetical protein
VVLTIPNDDPRRNGEGGGRAKRLPLSAADLQTLRDESAIAEEVLAEYEVQTIVRGRELPAGFSRRQRGRAPGMLFTIPRPNGKPGHIFRPKASDPENPGNKYEQPCKALGGPGNVLGVYETSPGLLRDASVTVVFTEGAKKGLSLLSAARASRVELVVVVVSGVWNWLAGGAPIPDMLEVPVEGRKVLILFDSDMLRNPNVQDAAQRLAEHLAGRGAEVWVAFLHDGPDGSKTGADDFFARGGTLQELRLLTRPYDPEDFATVRLSRDERLRNLDARLWERWWAHDWARLVGTGDRPNATRGRGVRDAMKVLIDRVPRHGTPTADGVRVKVSTRTLALEAATSRPTLGKALKHAEAEGLLRIEEATDGGAHSYLLLVPADARGNLYQYGERDGVEENATPSLQARAPGGKGFRASPDVPRLRWSSPGRRPKRGTVKGTRKVRQGPPPKPRESIIRPGKARGAIIDVLEVNGGRMDKNEVADALYLRRARDLVRRKKTPKGKDGPLVWLEDDGVVTVEGNMVGLADGWRERLREVRESGKEIADGTGEPGAAELDADDYRRQREAYRRRHETTPDHHYANLGADGYIEDLAPADAPEPELSPLAAALEIYLERNPGDRNQPESWIANTLWCHDLYPGRATRQEVAAALEELRPKRRAA